LDQILYLVDVLFAKL